MTTTPSRPETSSDLARQLWACRTTTELNEAVAKALQPHAVTAYAIGFVPDPAATAPDPFLLLTWPRAWLELYAREGFAREDIVVDEASRATEPFTWREIQRRHPGASARIFAAAKASFGWVDGFLVPIRPEEPGGRLAVASLAMTAPVGDDPDERASLAELSFLAFRRAVSLAGTPSTSPLTVREREVMALVAKGRSDRDVAGELGFAVATARFHVEQAKRKLGARTRSHAVALAIVQGAIG